MMGLGLNIDPLFIREATDAYKGAFISRLQLRLPFTRTADGEVVRKHLQVSGALYLYERARMAGQLAAHDRWREHKAEIAKIAELASRLRQELAAMDPEAAAFFWRDLREATLKLMSEDRGPLGDKMVRNARGMQAPARLLDEAVLTQTAAIIEDIAADASSRIKLRIGKPRNVALQLWVGQMRLLFDGDFAQSFTYSDGPDGQSQALQFCVFAIAPLDADVTAQEVGWGLRQAIRQARGVRKAPLAQTGA